MLCENCNRKQSTSIFMPPNQNKIMYLCGECYKKINNDSALESFAFKATQNIKMEQICKNCGLTLEEFKNTGLFGCESCYKAFSMIINEIIPKFNLIKYLGKKPNIYYVEQEIKNLQQLIEMCLKEGNYQKATLYGKELEKLKEENYDRL